MNAPVKRHLMDITARPEIVFARGEGSWLWDVDGRRYLDFVQGWAVNCLHGGCSWQGRRHPTWCVPQTGGHPKGSTPQIL